jgi:RNA polymerase sigma-70 factor (ECF subfamily)
MVAVAAAELEFALLSIASEDRAVTPLLTGEAAWARLASRGDRQAFGRLVDLHKKAVYGLCVRLLRDPEEARDAAQEAFARCYGALSSFDPSQPFGPWVLRIARNHCLDVIRRRLPDAQRLELDGDPGDGPDRDLPDPTTPRADDALEQRQVAAALSRAVEALPPNYRTVVHLFHVEHLSYKEIAASLEVPIGTVMTWLHRARARLRESLAASGAEVQP